jgi:DNA-binding beta-propeller fold protein YncE
MNRYALLILGLVALLVLAACGSSPGASQDLSVVAETPSATAPVLTRPKTVEPELTEERNAESGESSSAESGESTQEASPESEKVAEGTSDRVTPERSFAGTVPAPEFPAGLDWLNTDRPLTLEQLKGKVVVLDFWTYGCINCMHVIPDLKRLEEEYPNELVVIGVHSAKFENEGDTDNIRQVILRYELEHPVVNDHQFEVWRTWGAQAWPTLVLIDPAGNVVGGHSGEGIYPLFKPVIESLVQEFDANGILDRTPLDLKLEKEGLPETVLSFPGKVLADGAGGRLFIADTNHNRVVVAELNSGEVLSVIGAGEYGFEDGDFGTAAFAHPQGMTLSPDGKTLYVADTENHAIRRVDLEAEKVSTLAGTGLQSRQYPPIGGQAPDIALNSVWDLELDGQRLYIAMAGTHQLWVMDLESGFIGPFAGNAREGTQDGLLAEAELAQPSGLSLDGQGRLYFTDPEASTIRWAEIGTTDAQVGTLVGSGASLFDFGDVDGVGNQARLQHALGVVYYEGTVYVADTYNSKIKRVDPESREIETLLGSEHGWRDGPDPLFYEPGGIDAAGGKLYVADTNNHAVRIVDLQTKDTSTLVLRGIERFMPSADEEDFGGKIVQLEPAQIATGPGKVVLDLKMPEGYKVNELAPSSMTWMVEDGVVLLPPDANRSVVAPQFPMELDVTFKEGRGVLTADLTIFYCEAETESICLVEQVRLEAPLVVETDGDHVLELAHVIELPDEVATATPAVAKLEESGSDRTQVDRLPSEWQVQLLAQLENLGPAPELHNQVWLNSEALSLEDLRGQVVLVEFWTFG